MRNYQIHSTAIVENSANLGTNVLIGPYAIIEQGAVVGDNSTIQSHAIVKSHAIIGSDVEVGHFSVIGGDPQHMSFDRSLCSKVIIGRRTRIGEGVTVHRSIEQDGVTQIGEDCFLMGNSHIAHDCMLEDNVVLANGVLLGGHVLVGSDSFIGGGAAIHQFVRIGQGSMVGGLAEISLDIPPQVLVSGRNIISGLNLVGLKRRAVSNNEISELKHCFRNIFDNSNLKKTATRILDDPECPQSKISREFLNFFISGKRGFARFQKKT